MFIAALAIRLAVVAFCYTDWARQGCFSHWELGSLARSIALGHGLSNPFSHTGPSALMPPVYPLLLGGIFNVFGICSTQSAIFALSLDSLFSALTVIPLFFLARRSFGERVAMWAGWGWAFSPYGIFVAADWIWVTCLVTFLLVLLFLIALKLEDSDKLLPWLGFGLLSGFAVLCDPVVLAVLPLLAAFACHRLHRRGRRWLVPGAVAALACIAVMSPWTIRNYQTFHQYIPLRDGFGMELYVGNNGDSSFWVNRFSHPSHNTAELDEYQRLGEIGYMAEKREQAFAFIRVHPGWFVWMSLRRAVYMWANFWSFDPAYLHEEPMDLPAMIVCTTLSAFALFGLGRAFRQNRAYAIRYAIMLGCFPLVYYFTHVESYFFRPVDPFILILAVYAFLGRVRVAQVVPMPARQLITAAPSLRRAAD
jgi:4-amino-4-deoxy-L-arabinose transferase-like glycosyltransferase